MWFLRWSLCAVNFFLFHLFLRPSGTQKLSFVTCVSAFPGSFPLAGHRWSGGFHTPHPGSIHHSGPAPHCWVSSEPDPTEPRQRATPGSGLCELCVQKWVIVQPSLLFEKDRGEESQCTHPWHPNFRLDEIWTRDAFLLVFWQNKYLVNVKAISVLWGGGNKWTEW